MRSMLAKSEVNFYPRPPRGGRPELSVLAFCGSDFYPRPPRGGRRIRVPVCRPPVHISIHALREEGDLSYLSWPFAVQISIHALREEGDLQPFWCSSSAGLFLSTPSARRATGSGLDPGPGRMISIHALREEGDRMVVVKTSSQIDFYPRPPRGGRRDAACGRDGHTGISIHALREEGDFHSSGFSRVAFHFYPRPPRGGRLSAQRANGCKASFLSTPSARRATFYFFFVPARLLWISIHALREEGDLSIVIVSIIMTDFYPRPPRGGRPKMELSRNQIITFLSTPSARRATCHAVAQKPAIPHFYPRPPRGGRRCPCWCADGHCTYFYPRPPRGGRPLDVGADTGRCHFYPRPPRGGRPLGFMPLQTRRFISIHALREEGDSASVASMSDQNNFYPRPPRGGRPVGLFHLLGHPSISIHALREEGDVTSGLLCFPVLDFYPRPPRGGRHNVAKCYAWVGEFLSTPSARRATSPSFSSPAKISNFYPRPPRGGRPVSGAFPAVERVISIHALREEGDTTAYLFGRWQVEFLSTPSARRATSKSQILILLLRISIHALREEGDSPGYCSS